MPASAWITGGVELAICAIALIRFGNPRWALGWLVGAIAILDGIGFLVRDPLLLTEPGVDAANSGFLKEYMATQFLVGIFVLYAIARDARSGDGAPPPKRLLPESRWVLATLGALYFAILCFAIIFHVQSVVTHPGDGPGQQLLYAGTDAVLALLVLLSLLRLRSEPVGHSDL